MDVAQTPRVVCDSLSGSGCGSGEGSGEAGSDATIFPSTMPLEVVNTTNTAEPVTGETTEGGEVENPGRPFDAGVEGSQEAGDGSTAAPVATSAASP